MNPEETKLEDGTEEVQEGGEPTMPTGDEEEGTTEPTMPEGGEDAA